MESFGEDPSAVTRLMGLEPTAVGLSDQTAPDHFGASTSWVFDIAMPETESIEGQALALLRFLESHAEAIRQTAARFPASIAIGIDDQEPANSGDLILVPLIVGDVSKLGLGIRIHFTVPQS